MKLVPSVADDLSLSEAERVRGRAFAAQLSMRVLSRTWQMLLKGIAEVQEAGRPIAAAEMLLVRIAFAADLPTPDEVIRSLGEGSIRRSPCVRSGNGGGAASAADTARLPAHRGSRRRAARRAHSPRSRSIPPRALDAQPESTALVIGSFEELLALATEKRDLQVKAALERDVRLVGCEDGRLEIALEPSAAKTLVNELSRKLSAWTGRNWMVVVSREPGAPTLKAQADVREAELKRGVRADPLVQAVLERFPGAEIVAVRPREREAAPEPIPDDMPRDEDEPER